MMSYSARLCFTLALLVCCSGCGTVTIDGSSDEAFQVSVEKAKKTLPEADRLKFARAVEGFHYLVSENALSALDDSTRIRERVRKRLDGLSATELFELWDEKLLKSITDLEQRKEQTDTALDGLKNVQVLQARYSVQQGRAVVALKLRNQTDQSIFKVYFHGTLTTSDRRKPWVEDDFNYNITGGFKADTAVEWNFALLSPAWRDAPNDRSDLNLRVTVTRIDGENEEPIFDALTNRFTKDDANRLEKLKSYHDVDAKKASNLTSLKPTLG